MQCKIFIELHCVMVTINAWLKPQLWHWVHWQIF